MPVNVPLNVALIVCGEKKGRNSDGVKTRINSDEEDMENRRRGTDIWFNEPDVCCERFNVVAFSIEL